MLFFFVGKGGVGKTTLSSAFALMLARRGKDTLLLSTDPAHSLSDTFCMQIGSDITPIDDRLKALEIDPHSEAGKYLRQALERIERVVNPDTFSKVKKMFHMIEDSPGLLETAMVEKLSRIVLSGNFEAVVVDTAPTGHTIQMLNTISRSGLWLEELIRNREKEQAFKRAAGMQDSTDLVAFLKERRERLMTFYELITSKGCEFIPVLNPERLPILETERAVKNLRSVGISVKKLIVNKVLSIEPSDSFMKSRKKQEMEYIELVREKFADMEIIYIPLMEEDVKGIPMLERIAGLIPEDWISPG